MVFNISKSCLFEVFCFFIIAFAYPYVLGVTTPFSYTLAYLYFVVLGVTDGLFIRRINNPFKKYVLRFFAALYFICYVVKLVFIRLNEGFYKTSSLSGIGCFDFSLDSYNAVLLISLIGIVGVFAGVLLEHVFDKRKNIPMHPILEYTTSRYLFSLWIVGTYLVDLLLWYFGYGQAGVDRSLPFHLQGFIYYYRMIIVPFISLVFLDVSVKNKSKHDIKYYFIAIVIGAVICQFASLSRGVIITRILPILLYAFFYDQQGAFGSQRQKKFFGVSILLLTVFAVSLVTSLRDIVWGAFDAQNLFASALALAKTLPSMGQSIASLFSLLIARAVGIQELMGVYAARGKIDYDLSLFAKLLSDSKFFSYYYHIEVLGGINYSLVTGGSPALFGFLYFSGSIVVVFLGSLIGSFIITKIGSYFYNLGFQIAAYGLATVFILLFWSAGFIQAATSIIVLFLSWILLKYVIWLVSRTWVITINGCKKHIFRFKIQ